MSAASAAETVQRYTSAIRFMVTSLGEINSWAQRVGDQQTAIALADGDLTAAQSLPRPGPPPQNQGFVRETLFAVQDDVTRRLWARQRIVYDIDPDLWTELGDVDEDTILPGGILGHLPHPDPFIVLPEPIVLAINGHDRLRIGGFWVVGTARAHKGQHKAMDSGMSIATQVSTHAPTRSGDLLLTICGEVEGHDGTPKYVHGNHRDMVITRVRLDVGDGNDKILSQLIEAIASRFDEGSWPQDSSAHPGGFEATVRPMLGRLVSLLIYLCSTNAELRPYSASVIKRTMKGSSGKPPKVVEVGHITGAALRAWARRDLDQPEAGLGGAPRRPHIRRAHFHLYWTGPGRTVPRMKWLAPIPINATGQDAEKSTVVGVIPQKR